MTLETFTGGCHCGGVRYEADLDLSAGSNRCNCSYCAKARAWFIFAKGPDRLRLLNDSTLAEYRWTPPGHSEPHLTYVFCRVCGIRAFGRGELESLGGVFHAVHVPTLDLSDERRATIPVCYINGRDGRDDQTPEHTEAL